MHRLAFALSCVLVLVATACDRTERVVRDADAISRIDVEPPGGNCAAGGHAIRTGPDRDADGVLDDGEVTSTKYACAEAARTLLVDPIAEPAGANCALGGTAVRAGLDEDGDGALDEEEVDRISYVCGKTEPAVLTRAAGTVDSASCPAGATRVEAGRDVDSDGVLSGGEVETSAIVCGDAVLVARDHVWSAPGCASAATRIRSGADADDDGVLDDVEVTSAVYVCSETIWDFVVTTQEDLDYLRDRVAFVRGNVAVRGTQLAQVSIPPIAVAGSVTVEDNPGLTSVSISPGLIGRGIGIARNPKLESASVWAPAEGVIAGSVAVSDNPALEYLRVYAKSIGGDLLVSRSARYLTMDELVHVGGDLRLEDCDRLTHVQAQALASIGGSVVFRGNDALETFGEYGRSLGVETVGGAVVVEDNAALRYFELPSLLLSGGLRIRDNAALTTFDFFELSWIDGDYEVSGNPRLWSTGAGNGALRRISGDVVIVRNGVVTLSGTLPVQQIDGEIVVSDNPALTHLWFQVLPWARRIAIERNGSLAYVGASPTNDPYGNFLGALRSVGVLRIAENTALQHLRMPSIGFIGSLYVERNPKLATCEAQALAARSGADVVTITGNDDVATCPQP